MNFFKLINLGNVEYITQILFTLLEKEYRTNEVSYIYPIDVNIFREQYPEVVQLIELAVDDSLHIARVFVTMPDNVRDKDVIHSDGSTEYPKYLALNWPLINTVGTTMCWYDAPIINTHYLDTYGSVQLYNPVEAILLAEYELLAPSLVRIDIPHNVKNFNNQHRVIISFRFLNELRHITF